MPQSSMDYWIIAGVIVAVIGVAVAVYQAHKGKTRTSNTILRGHRNTQVGGAGETVNHIENGNDNSQRGA